MLFIGIDIASKKHDFCMLGENGAILAPIFTLKNDASGFDLLMKTIKNHSTDKAFADVSIIILFHFCKVNL